MYFLGILPHTIYALPIFQAAWFDKKSPNTIQIILYISQIDLL